MKLYQYLLLLFSFFSFSQGSYNLEVKFKTEITAFDFNSELENQKNILVVIGGVIDRRKPVVNEAHFQDIQNNFYKHGKST